MLKLLLNDAAHSTLCRTLLKRFMVLKGRDRKGTRDRALPSTWILHEWPQWLGLGWDEPRNQEFRNRDPSTWTLLYCFPSHTNRELDRKWNSWDQTSAHMVCWHRRRQLNLMCYYSGPRYNTFSRGTLAQSSFYLFLHLCYLLSDVRFYFWFGEIPGAVS